MMRILSALLLALALPAALHAQATVPQNARQALLEMLFGKPGSFQKHLPKATLAALSEASGGGPSMLDQFSMLAALANAPGSQLQTFETGSTLLSFSDERTHSKFEVNVDNDDLRGEEDEIQLSFHGVKEGQPLPAPVMPTLSVLMKQETGIWKLNELALTIRVPLTDPEFLKMIVTAAKQRQAMAAKPSIAVLGSSTVTTGQARANEASAIAAMRSIVTAEVTYSATYPNHGFTCTLSDLDGFGSDSPNEHQAMLIESGLASGKKGGYVFALTGCTGLPSAHFQVVAVPAMAGTGARAFCSDQGGVIHYSADGQGPSCLASGKPLQ